MSNPVYLGRSSVQRALKAPNRKNRASRHYRCVVDARVPKKRNSLLHENINNHFYTARAGYVKEAVTTVSTH